MDTMDSIALVPDGSIDLDDMENFLWLPFFFVYPAATPPAAGRDRNYFWISLKGDQ